MSVKEKTGDHSTGPKQVRRTSRIISPERRRKRTDECPFVNKIERGGLKVVGKKIAENDVVGQGGQRLFHGVDRDWRKVDRGHAMTGPIKSFDASIILAASGDQDIAVGLERSKKTFQSRGHVIDLPRSSPARVTLRPKIRLSAVRIFLQNLVTVSNWRSIVQSRCDCRRF